MTTMKEAMKTSDDNLIHGRDGWQLAEYSRECEVTNEYGSTRVMSRFRYENENGEYRVVYRHLGSQRSKFNIN